MGYAAVTLTYPGSQTSDPRQHAPSSISNHHRYSLWQEEVPPSDGGTGKWEETAYCPLWWYSTQTGKTGYSRGCNSNFLPGGTQGDYATTPRPQMRTLPPDVRMRGAPHS